MVVLETPLVSVVRKDKDLNLVKFCDIRDWYSLEEDIFIEFIIEPEVRASTLDWIGLFRQDWNTFESFITFQRGLGSVVDLENPRKRKVKFPYSRDLIKSVLLDYKYQFVYIDRYLEILGTSPLFRFILPLKSLSEKSKSLTLAEEMLISENPENRNYISSCRYHRNPNYRNMVTTCGHCRPCGHDYYIIKEKTDITYAECLRLSDRLSYLESEVALHSLKINGDKCSIARDDITELQDDSNSNSGNDIKMRSKGSLGKLQYDDIRLKSADNFSYKIASPREEQNPNYFATFTKDSENIVMRGNKKKTSSRSLSYPQEAAPSNSNDLRKTCSDGKLVLNECYSLSDVDSPLILKAIIGHQEERIRQLTQLLNQKQDSDEADFSDDCSGGVEDGEEQVVRLVRTQQRMLAQILRINNNCEEFSTEKELLKK